MEDREISEEPLPQSPPSAKKSKVHRIAKMYNIVDV